MESNQTLSYKVEDAVKVTGLSRSRIYQAIGTGELRSFLAGKRRMVTAAALQEWIGALEKAGQGRKRA